MSERGVDHDRNRLDLRRLKGVGPVFITIYEYVHATQPGVLILLRQAGLLVEPLVIEDKQKEDLTYKEIVALMRHDRWKRVRGALRQIHPGRLIG